MTTPVQLDATLAMLREQQRLAAELLPPGTPVLIEVSRVLNSLGETVIPGPPPMAGQPITDEQTWAEAAAQLDFQREHGSGWDTETDSAREPYLDTHRAIYRALVAPLGTRVREQADEIERWEAWSNNLTDLLPNMRDGDESQEFLIEQAIRALVTRAEEADDADREMEVLRRRVRRVRALHRSVLLAHPHCDRCAEPYPCQTIRLLDGESP